MTTADPLPHWQPPAAPPEWLPPDDPPDHANVDTDSGRVGWDRVPVPLGPRRMLPPFPVDALPGWVGDYVQAVAIATQTPVDLAGSVALACLSTAAGGRAEVVAKPDAWTEPVNIYTVVALPPGSRKSTVFRSLTRPLTEAERLLREQTEPRRISAEIEARVAKAKAEAAAKDAEHATDPLTALGEATEAADHAATISVPVRPRLLADDVTPEQATTLLAEQGGRLAILSAEGDVFATLTGSRYSNTTNLGVFLKGHPGDPLTVDRRDRSEYIDKPALTLGVTTQPGALAGLATTSGFRDRGVLARILYSLPTNTVGRRQIDPPPAPAHIAGRYTDRLTDLVVDLADLDQPHQLRLSTSAADQLHNLLGWIEPQLRPDGGPLAPIVDWAGKLAGAVCRLAGLLHLAHHHPGHTVLTPISGDTFTAATRLGHYYLGHALAVFDLIGSDPDIDDARHILDWITRTHRTEFTRRDLFRGIASQRFTKVTELDPPLALLTEHGHVRPRPNDTTPNGGRPTVTYQVHPTATPP